MTVKTSYVNSVMDCSWGIQLCRKGPKRFTKQDIWTNIKQILELLLERGLFCRGLGHAQM